MPEEEPTVAIAVLEDDHVPPVVASVSVRVPPTVVLGVPEIAAGAAYTVTGWYE